METVIKYNMANSAILLCAVVVAFTAISAVRKSSAVPDSQKNTFRAAVIVKIFSRIMYCGALVHFLPALIEFDTNFDLNSRFNMIPGAAEWDPSIKKAFQNGKVHA
mgnify:CR=1 FL=1